MRNKLLITLMTFVLMVTSFAYADTKFNVSDFMIKTASEAIEKGESDEAKTYLVLAHMFNKHDDSSLIALSELYTSLGSYEEAEFIIDTAIENKTQDNGSEEYNTLAEIEFILSDYESAMENFTAALSLDEDNVQAIRGLAKVNEMNGNIEEASKGYLKVLELTDDLYSYKALLKLYEDAEDYYSLYQYAQEAYKAFDDDLTISVYYGMYMELYKKKEAYVFHENLNEKFKDDPESILVFPNYLFRNNQYTDLITYLEDIKVRELKNDDLFELYIDSLYADWSFEKAHAITEQYIKENPDDYVGHYMKGKLLNSDRLYIEAIDFFEEAIKQTEKRAVFDLTLENYVQAVRHKKAILLSEKMLEMFGEDNVLLEGIANSNIELQNYEAAAKAYEKLLKLDNTQEEVKYKLGLVYYILKEDAKALRTLESYNNLYNGTDQDVSQLINSILDDRSDAELIKTLFSAYYLYDFDEELLSEFEGKLTDEEINDNFYSIKDPDDRYTFFLYGDYYTNYTDNGSGFEFDQLSETVYYMDIDSFTGDLHHEFIEYVDTIENNEDSTLIIDLRDNGGGSLASAYNILNNLTTRQANMRMTNKNGFEEAYFMGQTRVAFEQIYVLVNRNSASSSEILSLGLQEFLENATIVGEQTHGKGVGQHVHEDRRNNRVYFIVSFYWNIGGKSINQVGVTPDVVLSESKINAYIKETLNLDTFDKQID